MSKLKDTKYKEDAAIFPFLKRLFSYCLKYKKWLVSFCICVLMVAAAEAVMPLLWLSLLDKVILPSLNSPLPWRGAGGEVFYYALAFFGLGIVVTLSVFGFINFAGKIQENVMYDIRQLIFIKLQKLSFSFYDKSAVGWLLTRISSDTIKVTELISWSFIEVVWGIGMIIFCIAAMFIYNWKLAIIITLTIPVLALVSYKIRQIILYYSRKARKYNSEITARFNEHINGVEVNKSLVQEDRVSEEFKDLSDKMRHASYKSAYFSAIYLPLVIFIGSTAAAFVIYYGGNMAVNFTEITVGTLAAFFGYATLIYEPIWDISRFYSQAQNSISAGERIFSLLDTQVTITDNYVTADYDIIEGNISFENVSFSYVEGKPVLHDFNLEIEEGQSIALVGETGGGKSTIVNLICRFYEPVSGKIRIDGIDYKTRTVASLRRQTGVVLQTPHLFSGTVRENINYSVLNAGIESGTHASDEEIINALLLAGADEFVNKLDENVGEGGENLSMGQKQLLSFARAILANPRIFIMDEATSSIDTLTEARIQKGISAMMKDRTSIIIAHRLSTIKHCDRILVINRGKIAEDGSHSELIAKKGYYYSLYTRQLRSEREKQILEPIN